MKFIKPVQITDAEFVSSSVAEADYAAWSSGTTYAAGDKVIKTATHRIYESVQAGNTNHDPATDDGTWWIDIGPTNRWAMFDATVGTSTAGASPITVTVAPGVVVNSLALLDLVAGSVQVSMTDGPGGPTVYDQTYTLGDTAEVLDWYAYFFDEIVLDDTLIVTDLPAYASGRITVEIASGGTPQCGTFSIGTAINIGQTLTGVGIGIIDYSRKETDIYGVTSVLERAFAKKIEAGFMLPNNRIDYVAKALAAVRATPCVWIAGRDDGLSSLTALGFWKDWRIDIAYPDHSDATITIEGLT